MFEFTYFIGRVYYSPHTNRIACVPNLYINGVGLNSIDLKFVSGITNIFWLCPYTDVCEALYTPYFPKSYDKNPLAY